MARVAKCCICKKNGGDVAATTTIKGKKYCATHAQEINNKLVACKQCGRKIPLKDMVGESKSFCSEVCENVFNENKMNTKAEEKSFLLYLEKIFKCNTKELPQFFWIQITKFRTKFNYSYKGLEYTLKYMVEHCSNIEIGTKMVSLIPYKYDEANEYYTKQLNRESKLSTFDVDSIFKEKTIKLKRVVRDNSQDTRIKRLLITEDDF